MKLRLLLLIALSVLLIPGLASAGCLISIVNLPQEKTLTMDVNWQTPYGSAFGSTQDGYVVPLDSKMIFKNILMLILFLMTLHFRSCLIN